MSKFITIKKPFDTKVGSVESLICKIPSDKKSKCCQCGQLSYSDKELPYYREKPDLEYNEYYCGCRGWD